MDLFRLHELVHCAPAPLVGAVIINDDNTAFHDLVVKIFETDFRGRMPVAVQTQNSNRADLLMFCGKGVLKLANMVMHEFPRISNRFLQ